MSLGLPARRFESARQIPVQRTPIDAKEEKGVPLRFRELEGGVETDPNSSRVCGIFTTG